MKTLLQLKTTTSFAVLFIAAVLWQITALHVWAIPRIQLAQEDGSAMYIADTIHLFANGADPALVQGSPPEDDQKIPLLLIHGINKDSAPGPSLQDGWHNFVTFFNATPELKGAYKPYVVAYKSNVVSVDQLGADLGFLLDQLDLVSHGLQNKQFVILAHSMGGLVSRAMMNKVQRSNGVKWGERVLKAITLATPHHGTPFANEPYPTSPLQIALGVQIATTWFVSVAQALKWSPDWTQHNRSDLLWDQYEPCWLSSFGGSSK